MFGPVIRSHRVTVDQMIILERCCRKPSPTCVTIIREAMDEAIRRVCPRRPPGISCSATLTFNWLSCQSDRLEFSAGCKQAIADAKKQIFQPIGRRCSNRRRSRRACVGSPADTAAEGPSISSVSARIPDCSHRAIR